MSEDLKVYTPTVIAELPLPLANLEVPQVTSSAASGDVFSPPKIEDSPLPTPKVATELISTVINTKSKKILQTFDLAASGGFRIGTFQNGISGEIDITPSGILATNKSGVQTMAIDGETGDAVFAGQLQTGSVIAGQMILGDGSLVLDGVNNRIISFVGDKARIVIGNPN